MKIPFDQWKAEYEPRLMLEPECDTCDWEDRFTCECEFLYPYQMGELPYYLETADEDKERGGDDARDNLALAISENRVWTWDNDGMRSGITSPKSDLLVTTKPWTEETEII